MKFDIIWSKFHIYFKLDLAAHYLIARGFFNVENFWMLFTHLGLNCQIRIVIKYIVISKISSLHETNLNIHYYQHNIWYFYYSNKMELHLNTNGPNVKLRKFCLYLLDFVFTAGTTVDSFFTRVLNSAIQPFSIRLWMLNFYHRFM